ncbi:MAG: hypothetical protein IH891_04225 [Planctomycetes bacterium]|nr:hypothetical protein [Planctomycetota bacterium]
MDKTRIIPSMFHRRLLLLLVCMCLMMMLLGAQLFRLSVIEKDKWLRDAESRLSQHAYLPTHRGRILDRNGNILALDKPSYDVAVEYEVITGRWPIRKAERQARREVGREDWKMLSKQGRQEEINARIPEWEASCERLWYLVMTLGEIDENELLTRCDAIRRKVKSSAEAYRERTRREEGINDNRPLPAKEEKIAHVILTQISDQVAFEFRKLETELPGMFEIKSTLRRVYPWTRNTVYLSRNSLPTPIRLDDVQEIHLMGVADHLIGAVRDTVWAEDMARRPFLSEDRTIDLGGYRHTDVVGSRGLERAYEDVLRGEVGVVEENLETAEKIVRVSKPGSDLTTTIDILLQSRVQAILSPEYGLTRVQQWQLGWESSGRPRLGKLPLGSPLNAAAVVLEVSSGEILAMVTMPTRAMGERMSKLQRKIVSPAVNRAYEALYPPGSIIKPMLLSAAVTEGVLDLSESIECTGHFFAHSKQFARCWIYRDIYNFATHGSLEAEEALGRSCNMFFYTLADRLGMERLIDWYGRYGIGQPLNIGLDLESEFQAKYRNWLGRLPNHEKISQFRLRGEIESATVFMGIGQGPITWTPLHAANAYATLARGGTIRDATIVMAGSSEARVITRKDLNLKRSVVDAALEGLRQSIMASHGTGHHILLPGRLREPIINAEGVTVWAKTGTAQAPPLKHDDNGDGEISESEVIEHMDHAWFVGLVGPRNGTPLYAISVIVEYGGSGGRTAGPIANQIIRALQAEGYLPGHHQAFPEESE